MSALHDAAVAYVREGRRVFPIHTADEDGCSCGRADCESPAKHPRTRRGVNDATANEAQVKRWWTSWPDSNIGIAAGDGLTVLDIDPRHGGDAALESLQAAYEPLPETHCVATGGGGRHFYFRSPTDVRSRVLAPGVEVKGTGAYVVAPPSLHKSGRQYVALGGDLADAPPWLLSDGHQRRNGPAPLVEGKIPEGRRNITLTSLSGSMRRRGMGEAAIFAALSVENAERCRPPLDDDEVRRIAASVARYQPVANGESQWEQVDVQQLEEQTHGDTFVEPTDDRAHLLARANNALKMPDGKRMRRVVHSGSALVTYAATLEDGTTIELGESHQVAHDPRRLDARIAAAAGHEPPYYTPKEWRPYGLALVRAAVADETATTAEDEIREWLGDLDFSATIDLEDADTLYAALRDNIIGFRGSDERLYVRPAKLVDYVKRHYGERVSGSEIRRRLGRLGFTKPRNREGKLAARRGDKTASRRFLASPPGFDVEA
ncbi:MAG: bifunctional DNA primase/polymerase [Actinomycetota bacterium]|nr:bifunctional DNA primase/polymerase [Actinomycetota bacterium]